MHNELGTPTGSEFTCTPSATSKSFNPFLPNALDRQDNPASVAGRPSSSPWRWTTTGRRSSWGRSPIPAARRWLVNRYDDSCNSYFDHDLHKLITVGKPQEIAPTASVQIRRYTHEIRSWDNRTKTLGDVQGHVITERFVEHFAGKLKHPPHYYVVEIVYRGRTCYALNRNP